MRVFFVVVHKPTDRGSHVTMGSTETKIQVQSKVHDPCNLYVDNEAGKPYFSRVPRRPTAAEDKKSTDDIEAIEKTMELQSVTELN